jgi:hypothetical protein
MRVHDACFRARGARAVFLGTRKPAFVLAAQSGVEVAVAWMKEGAVTIEDDRDTRTSNWTLATKTLPGRRDIQAPTILATLAGSAQETTS